MIELLLLLNICTINTFSTMENPDLFGISDESIQSWDVKSDLITLNNTSSDCDVKINYIIHSDEWYGYYDGVGNIFVTTLDENWEERDMRYIEIIVKHEIGHALGLPHWIGDHGSRVYESYMAKQSIMYPRASPEDLDRDITDFDIDLIDRYVR